MFGGIYSEIRLYNARNFQTNGEPMKPSYSKLIATVRPVCPHCGTHDRNAAEAAWTHDVATIKCAGCFRGFTAQRKVWPDGAVWYDTSNKWTDLKAGAK